MGRHMRYDCQCGEEEFRCREEAFFLVYMKEGQTGNAIYACQHHAQRLRPMAWKVTLRWFNCKYDMTNCPAHLRRTLKIPEATLYEDDETIAPGLIVRGTSVLAIVVSKGLMPGGLGNSELKKFENLDNDPAMDAFRRARTWAEKHAARTPLT